MSDNNPARNMTQEERAELFAKLGGANDPHCHCRPEPVEAPEPNMPRRKDLIWQRAMAFGWRAMLTEEPAVVSIPSFEVGCRAAMEYLAVHDRRGK